MAKAASTVLLAAAVHALPTQLQHGLHAETDAAASHRSGSYVARRGTVSAAAAATKDVKERRVHAKNLRALKRGLSPAVKKTDVCGEEGEPACVAYDSDTGYTIHSCVSSTDESDPTIGAVPSISGGDVVYMCEECGQPYELACECTFDNPLYDDEDYEKPCTDDMSHWCVYQPQYVAVTAPDSFYYCIHNDTDIPAELTCGTLGYEACLDEKTAVYSCLSPSPDGTEVYAAQPTGDPNEAFTCIADVKKSNYNKRAKARQFSAARKSGALHTTNATQKAVSAKGVSAKTDCGEEGEPACTSYDAATGYTIHSCLSVADASVPTIGAVPSIVSGDVVYMCEECGQPFELACECTHDNEATDTSTYETPCTGEMSHWCTYQPQYVAVSAPDTFYYCIHNDTDTPEELACGTLGYEACLDSKTSVYSCLSPSPDGTEVYAAQPNGDPNEAYMCVSDTTKAGKAAKAKKQARQAAKARNAKHGGKPSSAGATSARRVAK